MKSAIELKHEEKNSFGDLIRSFEYVNLETNEVILEHTFVHPEGHHTTFLYDLRMFELLTRRLLLWYFVYLNIDGVLRKRKNPVNAVTRKTKQK